MEPISLCNCNTFVTSPLLFCNAVEKKNSHTFPTSTCYCPFVSASKFKPSISSSSSSFRVSCSYDSGKNGDSDDEPLTTSWAYGVLELDPQCSSEQLKAAFRTKVKQFHPDVTQGGQNSEILIRRVIQAYEILSNYSKSAIIESDRDCACNFSRFILSSSLLRKVQINRGHADDYQVHLAVGQCPRSCIHYVTPSQRIILEELLDSILNMPYDTSAEAELLYSLIVKANYENNRYQNPKKNAKVSSKHVDWF